MKPRALKNVMMARVDGPASYKLVFVGLGHFAHDDGSNAFPSVATLMEISERSRRTVQRALRHLEEHGLIAATTSKKGGRGRPTVYQIIVGLLRARAAAAPPAPLPKTSPDVVKRHMDEVRATLGERAPPDRPRDKIRRRRRQTT